MNNIILIVDLAFNCRAKRGERKLKDGRLVKSVSYYGATVEECLAEARENFKAGEEMAPGYAEAVNVHAYNYADWYGETSKAQPVYSATTL